jgi:ribosome-binding factor A
MPGRKRDHLNERIRQKLGMLLQRESADPRFRAVTIVEVRVAKDLANATVRFSCYEPGVDAKALAASLNHAAGFFAQALARSMDTRRTPRLYFAHDPGFDYAQEIEEKLRAAIADPEGGA